MSWTGRVVDVHDVHTFKWSLTNCHSFLPPPPRDRIYERDNCQEAVVDGPELVPMNNLLPHTKLEWALQMAEGLANLHNHARGLIIHDDVQLPQFMLTDDGRLKLGDFNRAEFILYDEEHGRYCKYLNGKGPGDVSRLCTVGRQLL